MVTLFDILIYFQNSYCPFKVRFASSWRSFMSKFRFVSRRRLLLLHRYMIIFIIPCTLIHILKSNRHTFLCRLGKTMTTTRLMVSHVHLSRNRGSGSEFHILAVRMIKDEVIDDTYEYYTYDQNSFPCQTKSFQFQRN